MREIRAEYGRAVIHSPWAVDGEDASRTEVRHFLTDDGAIVSHQTQRESARDCGCLKPPGGFCAECGRLVCVDCFVHCWNCNKPLCLCHGNERRHAEIENAWLCGECHGRIKGKRILRGILKPFLSFEE